jgi:hypothetical protein
MQSSEPAAPGNTHLLHVILCTALFLEITHGLVLLHWLLNDLLIPELS